MSIEITEQALEHLGTIVKQQSAASGAAVALKIEVFNPHTNVANISLSYVFKQEITAKDIQLKYSNFDLYIEKQAKTALINAVIDYRINHNTNKYELHINAPNLKQALIENVVNNDAGKVATDSNRSSAEMGANSKASSTDLFIRINNYIEQQINSFLAKHQGWVKLIKLTNLEVGVEIELEFHGGCRGCSMVQLTLKHNIEKRLKLEFKEIKLIKDITEHIVTDASYY